MTKDELKVILRTSIKSQRLLFNVSVGVVKVNNEYIILKDRHSHEFIEDKALYYDKEQEMDYPYLELRGETVIYGHNLFNKRGQEAIKEYLGGSHNE